MPSSRAGAWIRELRGNLCASLICVLGLGGVTVLQTQSPGLCFQLCRLAWHVGPVPQFSHLYIPALSHTYPITIWTAKETLTQMSMAAVLSSKSFPLPKWGEGGCYLLYPLLCFALGLEGSFPRQLIHLHRA